MTLRIGVLPLGRNTFDVEFAEEMFCKMLAVIDASGYEIVGPRKLLFDGEAASAAIDGLSSAGVDRLLIPQVTFTDAAAAIEAANAIAAPLSIWAVPEPRLGGRLRLNAFCGLNLASHALSRIERVFSYAYCDPGSPDADGVLEELISGEKQSERPEAKTDARNSQTEAADIVKAIRGRRIARLGEHPAGFDTCRYDAGALGDLAGISIDEMQITDLFEQTNCISDADMAVLRESVTDQLSGLDDLDQVELVRSLKLKLALDDIKAEGRYDAFAIRCWPETFTEYGGAVCGPVSMMGEARVPCACEADVYGALTQMILQEVTEAPVFLVDLVDLDANDNTGVVWHCGQAPVSMADPDVAAKATIHTNRKMPLLYEFPLKPGQVTFMRVSQSWNEQKMVLAQGEILKRDKAFTGTSGVVQFDTSADVLLNRIMDSGLEHHMALAYGDHRGILRGVAAAMNLPVLEL